MSGGRTIGRVLAYPLIVLIKGYQQLISPLTPPSCRYYPSCSAYALRAVEVHGAIKGSWLAGRRLLRCHPWTPGGYDPVPGTPEFAEEARLQAAAATSPSGQHDHPHHDLPDGVVADDAARSDVSDQRADTAHVRGVNCST